MDMAQTIEAPPVERRRAAPPKTEPRHARVVIRKVRPWSVLKVSLIFYTCVMTAVLLALVILYGIMSSLGVLTRVADLMIGLSLVDKGFSFDGSWLFSRALVIGVVMVGVWSLINVVVTLLYNLISDVVGGVEVTLQDRS